MARYSTGLRATGVGSTTLPFAALAAAAGSGGKVVEVGVFNTVAVAVAVKLVRLTTAGTPGAGTVEAEHYPDGNTPQCTGFDVYTTTGPTLIDLGYRTVLGAAIGAGVIWTFGDTGLVIPAGVANGIGIILAVGTGQICDWYTVWDE
jgi:hypothetical protein